MTKRRKRHLARPILQVTPAPPARMAVLQESVRRVLREHARLGRPVFVQIPGVQLFQWVLLKLNGDVKQVLGPTITAAERANPVAMARLDPPTEHPCRKRAASTHRSSANETPALGPTTAMMLAAALSAFWTLAARWHLTIAEQCALLAISPSTRSRWRRNAPREDAAILDRLRLILLTYQRLVELTGGPDDVTARVLRQPGSAENPVAPTQSLLEALSERSLLAMARHYDRLAAKIHAS